MRILITGGTGELGRHLVEAAKAAGEPVPRRQGVSLRQRAWPLRELMLRSQKEGADVVWGV